MRRVRPRERQACRGMPGMLSVFMLLFLLMAVPTLRGQVASDGAPAGEVIASDGFAEALLPEIGWRQAVLGRRLPEGTVIATWLDARAELELAGARLQLEPLTHVRVEHLGQNAAELSLQTGVVTVLTEGAAVVLTAGESSLRITEGRARLSREAVSLESGTAELARPGEASVPLEAGDYRRLIREGFGGIFSDP